MTGSTEEHPAWERRGRVQAPSGAAMNGVGIELTRLAGEVADHVFEHVGPSGSQDQDARLCKLFSDMESGVIRPDDAIEPIALRQGKVAIAKQYEHHADLALQQAVWVKYLYDRIFSPQTASGATNVEGILNSFRRMQSALLEAQRHLTALDILKNLEGKHYSQRASKGGHARSRAASQPAQRMVVDVMVKGMLYNAPGAIKRTQGGVMAVAHQWAERIFRLNEEFQFLDITSLGQLQSEVHTLLLKRLKLNQGASDLSIERHVIATQLRQRLDAFDNEDTARIKAKLSYERGFREGVQDVLAYLLQKRFEVLPDTALDVIRATQKVDDLAMYLDRLHDAASWQDVLRERASASRSR